MTTSACCGGADSRGGTVGPADPQAGCGGASYIVGTVESGAGPVPRVSTRLTACDRWGMVRVRWGVGRDRHLVPPGLYAVGEPDRGCEVLVTANYKLTFDLLRQTLAGRDAWLLVLDTRGINVWCAAGKGTFGTEELVRRVEAARLAEVVSHRRLIVPQLGAPGVAAHRVRERSGFRVKWGPVMMSDLPEYLDAGLKATPGMRAKEFPLRERAALIPMELVRAWKPAALLAAIILLASGVGAPGGYLAGLRSSGITAVSVVLGALLSGAVLVPLLLPWIPFGMFALKGALVGGATAAALLLALAGVPVGLAQGLEAAAWLLLAAGLTSFLAMNFTGASTYTSLSGVRREMRLSVPLQAGAGVLGTALLVCARLAA